MNMYYNYLLHDRQNLYSLLLRSGRLFQQYLVDAYICIEESRLEYIRQNQKTFRTKFLQGLNDAIQRGDTNGRDIRKRMILPSSFTGGPRYMYKHYQDALAICRVHGNPQYFITFTCNAKWPEIEKYVCQFPSLNAQDRLDIIARVFQLKVISLVKFLRTHKPFGEVAAELYTIEFQKRGLPHCHLLLWLTSQYKIRYVEQLDSFISTEIPNPVTEPTLHKVVTDFMIYGPCGLLNPNASCMKSGCCSKKFPKEYCAATMFDKNGYAHYKRRSVGYVFNKNNVDIDNGYVGPYNRVLPLHFHAHINVEYYGWNMMIKYLFKYISKGADRIRYSIGKTPNTSMDEPSTSAPQMDEISNFVDSRFICPPEASWKILNFPIHHRNPPVQALAVDLQDMQNVTYRDDDRVESVLQNPVSKKTTLTEWLRNNRQDPSGRHLRYVDYLSEYRWDAGDKFWLKRTSTKTPAIGRLIYIHPSCGETFFLRLLLSHQKCCQSSRDIRTVNGQLAATFRDA
ncbi:uncharacterized protein LOC143553239 [Bidens hawaiensis]|uniref:uncharacterized protein LOC143553239 n=1 Tax=Bidens hawaiensis TaxID=980011 RepID=UPI004049D651